MDAEQAYAFSHTLLRDAAYQLQLPAERARLHQLALDSFESWLGVPPFPQTPDVEMAMAPHPADVFAADLANHAALCEPGALNAQKRALYLLRAARFASMHDDAERASSIFQQATWCDAFEPAARRRCALFAANELVNCGKLEEAERRINDLLALARESHDVEIEIRAQHALAGLRWNRGRLDLAEEILRGVLSRAEAAGREDLANECRAGFAVLLCDSGRASAAMPLLESAVAHFRATGAQVRLALNLGNLALCLSRLGNFEASRQHYEEALKIAHREGARRREGMLQCGLGDMLRSSNHLEEAQPHYHAALKLLRETGDRRGEVIALNNFANLLGVTGRRKRELKLRERALEMAREMGNPLLEELVINGLAGLSAKAGRHEEAVARYRQSIEISKRLGQRYRELLAGADLADELLALGRFDEAFTEYTRVLELCGAGIAGTTRVRALLQLARIEEARGALTKAETWLNAVAQSEKTTETLRFSCLAKLVLATIKVRQGKLQAARELWREGMSGLLIDQGREIVEACTQAMRTACKAAGVLPLDQE